MIPGYEVWGKISAFGAFVLDRWENSVNIAEREVEVKIRCSVEACVSFLGLP